MLSVGTKGNLILSFPNNDYLCMLTTVVHILFSWLTCRTSGLEFTMVKGHPHTGRI